MRLQEYSPKETQIERTPNITRKWDTELYKVSKKILQVNNREIYSEVIVINRERKDSEVNMYTSLKSSAEYTENTFE